MLEIKGDLWLEAADARVITTNGDVNRDGLAVMGRGVALQAAQRFPRIRTALARRLQQHGNQVYVLTPEEYTGIPTFEDPFERGPIVTMPVKHHWREPADIYLIYQSCVELVFLADALGWQRVVMPRPGCGNGGLSWDLVKSHIQPELDNRFVIVEINP